MFIFLESNEKRPEASFVWEHALRMVRSLTGILLCTHCFGCDVWGVQRPLLPGGTVGELHVSAGGGVGVGCYSRVFGVAGMRAPPV